MLGLKEWIERLNGIKIIAIIVVNSLLLTGVYGQAIAGVMESERATEQFKQIFEDVDVPYSYGKITAGKYEGSDSVVINIQDLHNHAEVQKNISNIIKVFDEKYGVKRVYVEGAYGEVSTKWLTVIKEKKVKDEVIETLLKAGRLTGAEYYSAKENKAEIIKGLEKKEEYLDNLKRLGTIIENQETVAMHIEAIKETVKELQKKYYNKQQKKIEKLSKEYVSGKETAKKYFEKLEKYAKKLAIDTGEYENLSMYMELLDKQKEIDTKRATRELQKFVLNIKENVPYGVYSKLLSMTNNFKQTDKLYGYLIRLSRQYDMNLTKNYKELEKLFEYMEISQAINPLELVKEEQNFKDELNDRFSVNKVEQEIIFLSNFIKYYEEYLSGKITANDCKYYNKNIEKFKNVWVKYIDNREIVALEEYEKISDEFYKINMARNEYFMENMKEILKSKKIGEEVKGETEIQKSMNSLKEAKDIYITVTGGFHTQELSKMLSKEGITNIIITPNVTTGVKEAQKTYYEIAKEQAKISFQALSTLLTSSMPNTEKILELFKVAEKKQISKSEFEKSIKELVIEFNKEQSANEQPEIRVEMASEKEIIINDKKYRYEGNKVIEEEIKADKNKGMQKSVKSVKETIQKTVIISVGLSIITLALIPISILTGSFPVVAMIVGESISAIGAVFSWMTVIFKNSQINFLNNKRAKEIKERITKNKITESDGVSEEIKNKIKDKFIELGFKEEEIGTPDKELGENEFAEVKVKKAERGEKEFLHINYSLINKLFMDGTEFKDDVISNAYLRMFIEHELRHRNNTKWSEWQVSFFDIFSFIKAFIREIFKGSNIEEKKKEVVEKLIEETEGDFKEEDLDRALEGKEESYKNKVIGLLNKFLKNGGLIVNCAVKSLQAVINAQSIWQIAIQTMLTEISTEMFVKNNEKNINGGNTSIKTSMSTMKKVMDEEEYKAEGYETDANTLMENLKEGESAIVWVNKNHYITVTKLESEKYSISDPNVNGGKEIIYATKLLLNGMTVTLQSGEQVRYKTKDGKITVLSASEGLKEAVKSGQGNIRILSNKNMEKITGAGGYKKDINIIDAKFYDKDGVTCVDIIYTKDGGITRKKKSFKYKEKLTDPVKIKVKNHYKKYGMTDAEWVRTNGLDIPNMKQQIKNINNKKITKKVAGHGNINRNLKQKEHKEIKKINDKRIINNIEKNDKKVENKTSVVKNKDHNVDINQNINEVNKKNEVNKNQSNSKDEYNKRNIKNDKIENSNNQNDDNYIKQLKSVNDLINEQLSRLKNKSFRVVVFKKGEIKQIKDLLKVYLQKNNEVIDMKSLKDFVGLLEQEIKRDETIISLPAFRVSFIKNIADTELKKYNQNNQNNIKPKNSQVGNNGKNIGKNIRETKNIKHNDLKNKININNKDNNIIKKANDIEVNRIKEKGNINKISDKNETVKGIKVNENININIKKINNKKETNNIKKEIEKNKISIINKGVNNIDISQEVNEEKEKKRKRLEDYRGKLEKFLNLFSDNNVVTTGNNIILNKEQSKVIDDFLFYLMIDIFSIKGKYSELYNKFYEFIQYLKYQKDLIKDDKVELSKEKIKEIKKIVSEELEEQKNQNISNQKEDTGLLVEHVNDNKQERDINQQKNKETHNIKDNNIEIENNNRNKDIKQEKQNIVLNNKKVKSLITMINNILKRNNQYISIQDTIKIIRALNCIDDIEQNLKDSLKKYIDNINNVLENARNNPVIDINSIKLNEIKELLETGINNKSTGKKVININNDMNNLKEQKELINRIKNNRLPEKQNDKNINTNGKKTLKKLNYNVVCTFEELKNLNNLNKLNKTYYQPTELIWIKNGKIEIKDKEKIKNVYLDFTKESMVYDNTNTISGFYINNIDWLDKFKTNNNIDLEDFFVHVALNKAILEFIKSGIEYENNNLSAEQEEKLKEYFFSNLFSILKKGDNYYFIKKFSVVNYGDKNKTNTKFLIYNNYFFKIKDFGVESRSLKNEYDAYNKIKENQNLKGNINEYYCLFNKNFENKKHKVIVSKNLIKDGFMDLHDFLTKNKVKYDQSIKIIKEVLNIQQNLENKKLYNFDLKPANIMVREDKSKGTFEIKLIDYEGIAPEGSTCLVSTYRLAYDNCFLADKDLRSAYNDYIKFIFILNVLYGSYGINKENERICGTLYKLAVNDDIRKAKDTKSIKLLEDFIYGLDYFYKNINNFDEQFGDLNLDKDYFKRIKNLLEISLNLVEQRDGQSAKNIIVLKEKNWILMQLLMQLKEK